MQSNLIMLAPALTITSLIWAILQYHYKSREN